VTRRGSDLCRHGEFRGDCQICEGVCPHGELEAECPECNWSPGDPANLEFLKELEPDDFEYDFAHFRELDSTSEPRQAVEAIPPPWEIYGPDEEEVRRKYERQRKLIWALEQALERHGLPLHWEVLARMIRDGLISFKVSDQLVYLTLSRYKQRFEAKGEGIYGLRPPTRNNS
jgi:hypothetical protein